jgi:hypothetical protein
LGLGAWWSVAPLEGHREGGRQQSASCVSGTQDRLVHRSGDSGLDRLEYDAWL